MKSNLVKQQDKIATKAMSASADGRTRAEQPASVAPLAPGSNKTSAVTSYSAPVRGKEVPGAWGTQLPHYSGMGTGSPAPGIPGVLQAPKPQKMQHTTAFSPLA